MKHLYRLITGIMLLLWHMGSQAQSLDQNHVRTLIPRTKFSTRDQLSTWLPNKDSVETTVEYFDGLGRPIQTVMRFGSPGGKDLVQPRAYDAFGREAIKYLPYAMTLSMTGNYKDNALDPTNGVFTFYNSGTGSQQSNGMVRTTKPYAETVFEASPLNRSLEQGAPGATWQIGTGNTVTMSYGTNGQDPFSRSTLTNNPGSNRVALYDVTINSNGSRTLTRGSNNSATYATGQLYRTITWNENRTTTSGCLGSTEEYKDKEGRVVLKRTYNRYAAPGISTVLQQMSTYYVYDDLGNLCFVLPPAAKPDTMSAISQATLDAVCYQYRYDELNRMVAKKLPGKVWEYMVYNKLDQLVARQDSNLRNAQQWLVNKYDAMGRVILTGIFQKTGLTASAFRDSVYKYDQWDIRNKLGTGNGYTITSYPTTLNTTLTINFYDSYDNIPNFVSTYTDTDAMKAPTGLLVLSKKLILNTTVTRLLDVYYYDSKGRNHKTYSQHYLNGAMSSDNYDVTTTAYNFNDQPVTTLRQHYRKAVSGSAQLVLTSEDSMVYDHKGRLEQHWNQLTNGTMTPQPSRLLSQQEYNEVGQLYKKKLHSTNNGSSFYQTITYRYNPRGWMVQDSAQLFKQSLYYNDGSVPQYNGNISAQSWQTNGGTLNTYNYTYDTQNRLLSGIADNGYSEKGITYDLVGNMRTLARYRTNQLIDSLRFNYPNGGLSNQPDTIRDVSGNAAGAPSGTMAYTYRGDGQVKFDGRTGNTISYNLLMLPQTVTGANNITYWYDADGAKLAKVSTSGSTTTRTDYIDGIQYTSTNGATPVVDFIQTAEGRARLSGSTYVYEYDLTDHLGNARLTFTTSGSSAQVVQSTDYYPFGMTSNELVNGTKSKYLYNNKELQEETNYYDYGWRQYDPVIGRFTTIDPLAEKSRRWSPYNYAENNPVRFIDPDGMETEDPQKKVNTIVTSTEDKSGKLHVTQSTTTTTVVKTETGSITTTTTTTATDVVSNSETEVTVRGDVTTKTNVTTVDGDKTTTTFGDPTTVSRADSKSDLSALNNATSSLESFRNEHHMQFNDYLNKEGSSALGFSLSGGASPFAGTGMTALSKWFPTLARALGLAGAPTSITPGAAEKVFKAVGALKGPKIMFVSSNGQVISNLLPKR